MWEYNIAIAPKGKEATYIALSGIPNVIGGFLSGIISGALLQKFCPEDGGDSESYMVWLVIGLVSSTAVFFTTIFRS